MYDIKYPFKMRECLEPRLYKPVTAVIKKMLL
jgi:hypothetical protein